MPDLLFVVDHGYEVKYYRDVRQLTQQLVAYARNPDVKVSTYRRVDGVTTSTLDVAVIRKTLEARDAGEHQLQLAVARSDQSHRFVWGRPQSQWPSEHDGTAKALKAYQRQTRKLVEALVPTS